MIPSMWADIEYFAPHEFSAPEQMNFDLLAGLDEAREIAGIPFKITSSFRKGDPRSHGKGLAVDIACDKSRDRFLIVQALLMAGFMRIGIYDKHIHVDIDDSLPQQVMWWGTSK